LRQRGDDIKRNSLKVMEEWGFKEFEDALRKTKDKDENLSYMN
jgi:hypothetical protein